MTCDHGTEFKSRRDLCVDTQFRRVWNLNCGLCKLESDCLEEQAAKRERFRFGEQVGIGGLAYEEFIQECCQLGISVRGLKGYFQGVIN
jgi:hypothetical protein